MIRGASSPARGPYFHIGFTVPDLTAAMNEFGAVLGVEWRRAVIDLPALLGGAEGTLCTVPVARLRSS
jgi:hypothetical protein